MIKIIRRSVFAVLFIFILFPSISTAALSDSSGSCVKAKLQGDASTYNPTLGGGWKEGGLGVATGGNYNPDAWEAALQLDLAKEYGCGYGSGKVCDAVVSTPSGRSAVVRINDNGPLCSDPGAHCKRPRVIDLNEKSMQYLSNGAAGNQSGIIENVTVVLLCTVSGGFTGPLNAADRDAWNAKTFDVPTTRLMAQGSPFANGNNNYSAPVGVSAPGGNMMPPPQPRSASPMGNASPVPLGSRGTPPQSFTQNVPPPQSSVAAGKPGPSVAGFLAQPSKVKSGRGVRVSWTSLNMKTATSCKVLLNGASIGSGQEGTETYVSKDGDRGTLTFNLHCISKENQPIDTSTSVTVE